MGPRPLARATREAPFANQRYVEIGCVTQLDDTALMLCVRVLTRVRAALQADSTGVSGDTAREQSLQVASRRMAVGVSDVELTLQSHEPAGTDNG